MSYDLCVFLADSPLTDDNAGERYMALVGMDGISMGEVNPTVASFLADLKVRYPDIDEVPESKVADSPWSGGFDVGPEHVSMTIRPARAPEVGPFVVALAQQHGLVCFDPQEGGIIAAPPGIRVSECAAPLADATGERARPEWPFIEALDSVLRPEGYARRGRLWRRVGDTAIIAMRLWDREWGYEPTFAVWLRSKGEIDQQKVKPGEGGRYHFQVGLSSTIIPAPQMFRLYRALHTGVDYAYTSQRYVSSGQDAQEIIDAMEPHVPLTMEWRQATIKEVFKNGVLPMLARIESGEVTDPDELDLRRPMLERAVVDCRCRLEQGADNEALIEFMFDAGIYPGDAYQVLEKVLGLKSWEGTKLAERIDEKWEQYCAERGSGKSS